MCIYECLHAHVYTMCMPGPCGSQKRMSDPLGLELKAVVSHYVGPGNQIQALFQSNSTLYR